MFSLGARPGIGVPLSPKIDARAIAHGRVNLVSFGIDKGRLSAQTLTWPDDVGLGSWRGVPGARGAPGWPTSPSS